MGPIRIDLHVHSSRSPDSNLTLESIAARIVERRLDGFALTDHNTVAGHVELAGLRSRFPNLVLVPGAELSTNEGHLLAFGVSEVPGERLAAADAVAWVGSHGGVAVLAHPFRRSHGMGRAVSESLTGVGIEVVNGHNSSTTNRLAQELADRRGVSQTGGSDVHELSDVGRAFTEFPDGTRSVEAVLFALRNGHVRAGGSSLGLSGRLRVGWRSAWLRARRGFRPI